MAAARFLDVSEEETNKMKENAVVPIITCVIILKQLFSSESVNIVEQLLNSNHCHCCTSLMEDTKNIAGSFSVVRSPCCGTLYKVNYCYYYVKNLLK